MTALLPLETFRSIIGFQPFHFWQLANALTPIDSNCSDLTYEYGWKNNSAAGRDDIRRAIETAERKLTEHLGYSPAPHSTVATLQYPRYYDVNLSRLSQGGSDGRWLTVRLPESKIIAVGVPAQTTIGTLTQAQLTFIDSDGDNLPDVWLTSIATSVTDPSQIGVYFGLNDRVDAEAISEKWRISPLQITIAGGVATIRGKPWQIVRPIKYQGVSTAALDPSVMTNYALSLDVMRNTIDPTGTTNATAQAKLIWETPPYPAWAYCCGSGALDSSTDPAAEAYALARVGLRDANLGLVSIGEAVYNATTGIWTNEYYDGCRVPDRIEIRYSAGDSLSKWQDVIAHMAAAELGKRACACDDANKELYYWQTNLAYIGSANLERFAVSPDDLNNPFGTRLGQVMAYKMVKEEFQAVGLRV